MGSVELGHLLRSSRVACELSYRDLAAASGLALSHLQRLERGEVAQPTPATLRALSSALGVPLASLLAAAGYL